MRPTLCQLSQPRLVVRSCNVPYQSSAHCGVPPIAKRNDDIIKWFPIAARTTTGRNWEALGGQEIQRRPRRHRLVELGGLGISSAQSLPGVRSCMFISSHRISCLFRPISRNSNQNCCICALALGSTPHSNPSLTLANSKIRTR